MALFISHRFSTVRMADRIVVLENGRITEDGNHEQLTSLAAAMRKCSKCKPPVIVKFMEMLPNTDMARDQAERRPDGPLDVASNEQALRSNATQLAHKLGWQPSVKSSPYFAERVRIVSKALKPVLSKLHGPAPKTPVSADFHWLHENVNLLYTELQGIAIALKPLHKSPHVRTPSGVIIPRIAAIADGFLTATERQFNETAFTSYVDAYQESTVLKIGELWALVPASNWSCWIRSRYEEPESLRTRKDCMGLLPACAAYVILARLPGKTCWSR